jgi:hypothetical protein
MLVPKHATPQAWTHEILPVLKADEPFSACLKFAVSIFFYTRSMRRSRLSSVTPSVLTFHLQNYSYTF